MSDGLQKKGSAPLRPLTIHRPYGIPKRVRPLFRLLLASLLIAASSGSIHADDTPDGAAVSRSPLERLRLRSPIDRWDELKRRLKPFANRHEKNRPLASAAIQRALLPIPNEVPAIAPIAAGGTNIPASALAAPAEAIRDDQPGGMNPNSSLHVETAIKEIRPYFDYEPRRVAAQEKDCRTICPCADGSDCKKKGGTKPCPCPEDDIKQPWIVKTYTPRAFDESVFNWDASNVYSYPLYFEDKALERYGHTHHAVLQPFVSVRRLGAQLALLPYQMAIKPPLHHRHALGYFRPGEWAPKLHYQIPLNAKAALVQAGVVTGTFIVFP